MMDRRLTLANTHVADANLKGQVQAERFVQPTPRRIHTVDVNILNTPNGSRERQAIFGDQAMIIDDDGTWAFGKFGGTHGYVGYVPSAALGDPIAATHSVTAICGHAYAAPDFKSADQMWLPFGATFKTITETDKFFETPFGFVPKQQAAPLGLRFDDPAAVALKFLGTPYLWGGNTPSGIDCSGLIHAALQGCGIDCPGDADLQEIHFAHSPAIGAHYQRNQLLFWKGHVALTLDDKTLIHANVHAMAVSIEGIDAAITRIKSAGDGPVTSHIQL